MLFYNIDTHLVGLCDLSSMMPALLDLDNDLHLLIWYLSDISFKYLSCLSKYDKLNIQSLVIN